MKKMYLAVMLSLGILSATAQGWVYSEEFGTDFWGNPELEKDFIDCRNGDRGDRIDAMQALQNTRKYGMYSVIRTGNHVNSSDIYNRVARGVAAQSSKRSSSSASSGSRRVGTKNYNTSDAHIEWVRNRQAQIQAAREKDAHEKRMKQIAEDNRAAAITAQTNAMLQTQTNARIQRDQWHASQGAALAQQRARQAVVVQGPQFNNMKPRSTGSQQASRLRGANKPRRFMTEPKARNTVRKPMPSVQRHSQITEQQRQELQQAIRERRERQHALREAMAQRKKAQTSKSPAAYYTTQGRLILDEHAYSSLGRDWGTIDLDPLPSPPPIKRKMTAEEYHRLVTIEIIEQRPLTPAEEKFYENLTL